MSVVGFQNVLVKNTTAGISMPLKCFQEILTWLIRLYTIGVLRYRLCSGSTKRTKT